VKLKIVAVEEENMKKHFTITLVLTAASFLLAALPAAAQGRSAGHNVGAGAAGAHEPMGMGAAMNSHATATNDISTSKGSKAPGELLSQNSKLSDNLQKLLSGITPQQACANFKNLGQCVAAIHVAHNLRIDFNSLECDMTLKPVPTSPTATCPTGTGTKGMSLGASIQTLDPTLTQSQVTDAAKTGQKQAHADLSRS